MVISMKCTQHKRSGTSRWKNFKMDKIEPILFVERYFKWRYFFFITSFFPFSGSDPHRKLSIMSEKALVAAFEKKGEQLHCADILVLSLLVWWVLLLLYRYFNLFLCCSCHKYSQYQYQYHFNFLIRADRLISSF